MSSFSQVIYIQLFRSSLVSQSLKLSCYFFFFSWTLSNLSISIVMEWSRPECITPSAVTSAMSSVPSAASAQDKKPNLFWGALFRLPKAANFQDLHAQLLISEDLGIPIDAASRMSTPLDFSPPDNLGVLPTWIPFWSAVLLLAWFLQVTFTKHSLPATLLPDSRVYFCIQDAMMENSFTIISTSLPGAITEHSYDSLIPPETFNSTGNGTPNLYSDWCYKPLY